MNPNTSLGIGIVGCGSAGSAHCRNLLSAGGVKAWAWDRNPAASAALAKEVPVTISQDFESMLWEPGIDLMVIATPNVFHASMGMRALEAGKHVLVEKPMALDARDASLLVETAERTGRLLHVGFELRNSLFPESVQGWIADGTLGQLVSGQLIHYRGHFWPQWKGSVEAGGDLFLMEDCHVIDLFRWWSGSEVASIQSMGVRHNLVPHYEYPDTQYSTLTFRNGFVAQVTSCHTRSALPEGHPSHEGLWKEPRFGHQYEYSLVGENGSLHYLPLQGTCHLYRHERQPGGELWQRLVRTVDFPDFSKAIHCGEGQDRRVVEMLRGGGLYTPLIAPRDALQTHLVCFAGRQARETGETVHLTPSECLEETCVK